MNPLGDSALAHGLCGRALRETETKIESLLAEIAPERKHPVLLDVGCWNGGFSMRCAEVVGARQTFGIEVYDRPALEAQQRGLQVARIDLEAARFPWADASMDVVVCNQVLEHLKNVWLPMNEMHRVLRPGGHAIFSVPNLSSLHNRVLLALGRQPTSIQIFGPHIRGYANREFCALVELEGAYRIERRCGAGFYPIPSPWSSPLARLWPRASHTTILLARKTSDEPVWSEFLQHELEAGMQTHYAAAGEQVEK